MNTKIYTLIIITSLMMQFPLLAQNTFPTTGNVGINTTTPSAGLDVNANMIVDSSVVVKDSLTVQKKLIVDQDIRVTGKAVFVDNVKAKSDLTVFGTGKMKDKLVVDGVTNMNGDAKAYGKLFLKSEADTTINYNRLLTLAPNGAIKVKDITLPSPTLPNPNCGTVLPWDFHVNTKNPLTPKLYTILCSSYEGVGIGTTTPNHNLEVEGSTFLNGDVSVGESVGANAQFYLKSSNPSKISMCLEHDPTISDFSYIFKNVVTNPNAKAFAVTEPAASEDKFVVFGDGRVQILNDMSSNTKSFIVTDKISGDDVFRIISNGNVYATKIVVQTDPFPDYVFSEDYDLMSLMELEKYISKNKRLPKMPTANEVDDKGADLGEINRLLVEKVEELTLYIIEQEKRIKKLESKLN